MDEKRKFKRVPASLSLEISTLFKQNHVKIENIDAPIQVVDISKGGIGFITESKLPLEFYFNACLQLGLEDAKLYCVLKIIRQEKLNETEYRYGSELIGLAPVLSYIFEDYERSLAEAEE